jgi:Cu+-exporting ATPase
MVGTGRAAEHGHTIQKREALQAARDIEHVVLDKTGTLTEGKPYVIYTEAVKRVDTHSLLSLSASLEQGSEHPVAKAILAEAKEKNAEIRSIDGISAIPGKGVQAIVDGDTCLCRQRSSDARKRG